MGYLKYGEFKERLLAELKDFYGRDAAVEIKKVAGNNGKGYDGLYVALKGMEGGAVPVMETERIYGAYICSSADMEECVETVVRTAEGYECPEELRQMAEGAGKWEYVKENVYPVLLSTEKNRGMPGHVVSMPVLDLLVVYTIRGKIHGDRGASIKITESLFRHYGVSREELHRQALENMGKDGYRFRSLTDIVGELWRKAAPEADMTGREGWREMYLLSNSGMVYGAAGILNRKLVREFAGGRSFYILPSSVHETLFVPATGGEEKEMLDRMVAEINEAQVLPEEQLTDHAYYYDGKADEIRMEV